MLQSRFVDESTIEVIAQDGEKFTWNTFFPTPKQDQQYYAERLAYYFEKYFKDNIGDNTGMGMQYWIWIQMTYYEGLTIDGGKGDRDDERIFLYQERVRIGVRIRELRKEKNIEAKMLAQIANIDAANLSRIEQGRYSVGLDVLSKIAIALGAKVELTDFVEPKNLKTMVNVNHFEKECECIYKEEIYSVRDNGVVLRYPLNEKRQRPSDNNWTFGKLNYKTGYLEIASVRIHRIVATAFHGEPPTKEHVVDHIDTNKQNNRPDNLRWVTRLENILLNPITARRIELVCGSVEAFLADPSKFRDKFLEPNYEWMCSVSIREAQASKEKLLSWAKSDKSLQGGTLGEWIYNRSVLTQFVEHVEEELEFINSLTPNAVQKARNWKTLSEFPCCPQESTHNPIASYILNLNVGDVFSRNQYTCSIIECFAISKDENTLWIICKSGDENPIKPYSLAEITYQSNVFVHNSLGTFFEKDGAEKQFTLKQGFEWTGGETIDDYC